MKHTIMIVTIFGVKAPILGIGGVVSVKFIGKNETR